MRKRVKHIPMLIFSDCGPAAVLTNGYFVTPTGTSYGAVAHYACNVNYGLVGDASVECLSIGSWEPIPECFIGNSQPSYSLDQYRSTCQVSINGVSLTSQSRLLLYSFIYRSRRCN